MINNDNNKGSDIPDFDPSKPMNSKKEVNNSPDEKTDQDFPGYPHYPASEDIMHKSTGSHRVDANLEEMGTGPNATGVNQRFLAGQDNDTAQTNPIHRQDAGNEEGLGGTNEEIGLPQNVSNEDMDKDTPGTDIDEAAEKGSTNP
jgi:hypothetical protein